MEFKPDKALAAGIDGLILTAAPVVGLIAEGICLALTGLVTLVLTGTACPMGIGQLAAYFCQWVAWIIFGGEEPKLPGQEKVDGRCGQNNKYQVQQYNIRFWEEEEWRGN